MTTRSFISLAALLASSLVLPGCVINSANDFDVYDLSTVNPDRSVQQTRPVWDRPPRPKKLPLYEGDLDTAEVETAVTTTHVTTAVDYPTTDAVARTDPFTTNTAAARHPLWPGRRCRPLAAGDPGRQGFG